MINLNRFSFLLISLVIVFLSSCETQVVAKNDYERAVLNESRSEKDISSDINRKPDKILAFAEIKKGMVIADISAGTGYYSELFSYLVGETGKVYLHNTPSYMARKDKATAIKARLDNPKIQNVVALSSQLTDLNLPEKVDVILLSKVFHDLYVAKESVEREQKIELFFDQIEQFLNEKSFVLLIDHSAPIGSNTSFTSKSHRIDEGFVKRIFESKGFVLLKSSNILRNDNDDRKLNIWDGKIINRTDRFVYLFKKK